LGNRVIFSCRTLDYSASLSAPELRVPHVEVQPLNAAQIRQFLKVYVPERADFVWGEIEKTQREGLFRAPYFLRLLCEQVEIGVPKGRAALLTTFVREALKRELHTELFKSDVLLAEIDRQKLVLNRWRDSFDLPERGRLIPKLCKLAFSMQQKTSTDAA